MKTSKCSKAMDELINIFKEIANDDMELEISFKEKDDRLSGSEDEVTLTIKDKINDTDYYMKAIRFNGEKIKVKLSKKEFLKWCKELEDDEQGWELSLYARMISNI